MAKESKVSRGRRGSAGRGAFVYQDYLDNHAVWPGRESALKAFVEQTYGGMQHKVRNARSSNSEDALTWSCFDTLRQVDATLRGHALAELWELAFGAIAAPEGLWNGTVEIGKTYGEAERTEVDVSIEGPGILVFVEAKLYSPMSQAQAPDRPHDQIARKLRVGAREASKVGAEFFFILLDIAPLEALINIQKRISLAEVRTANASGFGGKWVTAYWFARYKYGRNGSLAPLRDVLAGKPSIEGVTPNAVARNMGWLTWADVFKIVLRATICDRRRSLVP